MTKQLDGQVAIVTGGGRGIGQTIARMLATEGAAVMVTARSADQLAETVAQIEAEGGRATSFAADVSDPDAVERMVAETERQLGSVDLLINNAAVEGPLGPIWEVDPDAWWRAMEINVRGTFLPLRCVLPGMIDRERGCIINISTLSAFGPLALSSSYAAAKAACVNLTESVAQAGKRFGVTAFALNPGLVHTAMTEYLMTSPEGKKYFPFYRIMGAGHWLPPERAAEVCVWLASGKADALTGRFIDVYDDLDAMLAEAEDIKAHDRYTMRLRR